MISNIKKELDFSYQAHWGRNVFSTPNIPTKAWNETFISKNTLDCFNMQASLAEYVDGETLQILDDLLNLSEGSESTSQIIRE